MSNVTYIFYPFQNFFYYFSHNSRVNILRSLIAVRILLREKVESETCILPPLVGVIIRFISPQGGSICLL